MTVLKAGNKVLPSPTSLKPEEDIIWSSDTGRTLSGQMVGDVVAKKSKISITWGVLTCEEMALIEQCLPAGFFSITYQDGSKSKTLSVYRGTLTKEVGGILKGKEWFKSANVNLIQR